MKKVFLFLMLGLSVFSTMSCRNDRVTKDAGRLPENALHFVQEHFPAHHISYIKIDREFFYTTYKVVLTNGHELEFDSDGTCIEVEGKRTAVPLSVIPSVIRQYLQEHCQGDSIEEYKYERGRYELELFSGLELIFDRDGQLEYMDN